MCLLGLSHALMLLLRPGQLPEHPALPLSVIAVGHPASASAPKNTTFVLPCIHEEHEFAHRRQYLERYHSEHPLQPRQRIEHFGHCWQPVCFRGVYDAFTTPDETDAMFRKFEPMLRKEEARKPRGQGAYIGYTLMRNEDATLVRIVRRMSALLESDFGARGAVPAAINLRSAYGVIPDYKRSKLTATLAASFQSEWLAKRVSHNNGVANWHYDNAKETDWLYTCLLYIGDEPEDLFGGSTVFVDELSPCSGKTGDCISAGMMVAPTRSRLLCFSSGPENIHGGSSAFGGYRVLLQIWWKCEVPQGAGRTSEAELACHEGPTSVSR